MVDRTHLVLYSGKLVLQKVSRNSSMEAPVMACFPLSMVWFQSFWKILRLMVAEKHLDLSKGKLWANGLLPFGIPGLINKKGAQACFFNLLLLQWRQFPALFCIFFGSIFSFAVHSLSNAENRTRNGWVGSANASSVLCRSPVILHLIVIFSTKNSWSV